MVRDQIKLSSRAVGLAAEIAYKTDLIIFDSIAKHIEREFSLDDVGRSGHRTTMPDGSEIFSYDGIALVQFWPVIIDTLAEASGSYIVTATRQYQNLI